MTKNQFLSTMEQAWILAGYPNVNKAVLFAQAWLETGHGGGLFLLAFNIFGVKAGKSWKGKVYTAQTKEWSKATGWKVVMANWKRYPSLAECIKDYARIINTLSWYKDALPYVIGPADEFLKNILPEPGEPGWATDPAYFYKIKKVAAEIASLGGPKWI